MGHYRLAVVFTNAFYVFKFDLQLIAVVVSVKNIRVDTFMMVPLNKPFEIA